MARDFYCISVLLFLLMASYAVADTFQATKPNIVFVLFDDWGFADVGFRNPDIKTPNFDMLAKSGLVL